MKTAGQEHPNSDNDLMEDIMKERSINDLLRAMQICATGATVHNLNNARMVLAETFKLYRNDRSQEARKKLDDATKIALGELAAAVWS